MKHLSKLALLLIMAGLPRAFAASAVDFYAGPSINRLDLLRGSKTSLGYQLGARYWFGDFLGIDAGWSDLGQVKNVDAKPIYPPGSTFAVGVGLEPSGPDSVRAAVRGGYLLLAFHKAVTENLALSFSAGPSCVKSTVVSDKMLTLPYLPGTAPAPAQPIYSSANWSWHPLVKLAGCGRVSAQWDVEATVQYQRAGSLGGFNFYGNADIGRRYIDAVSCALGLIYKFR